MSEKAVLVTGACGEIGQALVQKLAQQGVSSFVEQQNEFPRK